MNGPEIKKQINNNTLTLLQADITEMEVDAIVNAANKELILGSGVAGAIREKGGPLIQKECDKIGGTFVGGAVITNAGLLKARFVIHAVGPIWGEGDEEEKLDFALLNSLKLARDNDVKSIAFPAISTGIFGFPLDRCARIMIPKFLAYLQKSDIVREIYICLWEEKAFNVFSEELQRLSV